MSNMSYCQFENTYTDLLDCYVKLSSEGKDDLREYMNDYEAEAMEDLINLCKDIAREF